MKTKYDVTKHALVPKHVKLSDKDTKEILSRYNVVVEQLPRILKSDPAIQQLDVKEKDVIKITRPSPTNIETVFYRRVTNG